MSKVFIALAFLITNACGPAEEYDGSGTKAVSRAGVRVSNISNPLIGDMQLNGAGASCRGGFSFGVAGQSSFATVCVEKASAGLGNYSEIQKTSNLVEGQQRVTNPGSFSDFCSSQVASIETLKSMLRFQDSFAGVDLSCDSIFQHLSGQERLFVTGSSGSEINLELLEYFPNLKAVYFDNVAVKAENVNANGLDLFNYEELLINSSQLVRLPPIAWSSMSRLKHLELRNVEVTGLSEDSIFSGLISLESFRGSIYLDDLSAFKYAKGLKLVELEHFVAEGRSELLSLSDVSFAYTQASDPVDLFVKDY